LLKEGRFVTGIALLSAGAHESLKQSSLLSEDRNTAVASG
jgi:hypothetical protein